MSDLYGTPAPIPLASDAPIRGIGFGTAIKRYFTKYATFSGRASQSEYWWVVLFNALVGIALGILATIAMVIGMAGAASYSSYDGYSSAGPTGFGLVLLVLVGIAGLAFVLGTIIPGIALYVRRLHDADLSGLLALLLLIPYGNSIVAIVFGLLPSKPEGSRYDVKY
ncbi:DUF805 domain-containing protein [Mycetocola reblochoni]|uniref:Integral membrane protein n=2 Tax=Mycetocola reblochoni TaxID=331618 RepID=A0A1R4K7Y5_9MICO|nr:DUF805 domain-containing protein [Mycetocola reblochoni]RLP67879.1 DUF805 domain-containing protein [Mycetocola reblochoni]SJN40358.1 Integral membrane protein [Mycetocola reblochoni REB411]